MNQKTKHFSLSGLAYALVLILLATTMVGIVAYAAGSKTHNIGGNVSFTADGINATVEVTSFDGCSIGTTLGTSAVSYDTWATEGTHTVLQTITYNSSDIAYKTSSASQEESWSGLLVEITNTDGTTATDGTALSAGVATITFKVTNNSSDTLSISLNGSITKEEESDNTISITTSIDDETAYIGANSDTSVTITFAVTSASYDATVTGFKIPFIIDKVDNSLTTAAGLTYVYEGTEATLVSYSGSATEVEIDSTISVDEASSQAVAATASEQKIAAFANNEEEQTISAQSTSYTVTAIGAHAFASSFSANIESITIPSEITSIGSYAFSGCSAITTITIPKSVTAIGANAFSGCSALETIVDDGSLISEDERSFYGISETATISQPVVYTVSFNDVDITDYDGTDISGISWTYTPAYYIDDTEEWIEFTSTEETITVSVGSSITFRGGNVSLSMSYYYLNIAYGESSYETRTFHYYDEIESHGGYYGNGTATITVTENCTLTISIAYYNDEPTASAS